MKALERDMTTWLIASNLESSTKALPNSLLQLLTIVYNQSSETYLVGGCVRDMLLGKTPKDYDIVTAAKITNLKPLLEENGWEVKGVGDAFLVYVVSKNYPDGTHMYEVANFRKESKTSDGRRPDSVEIGTIEDDAARRDFTVNSLYYNPLLVGHIRDFNGGMKDLFERKLKFIGKPKDRIQEDYLRVYRFFRFIGTLKFTPDKRSLSACREYFTEATNNTTPERIRQEFERLAGTV